MTILDAAINRQRREFNVLGVELWRALEECRRRKRATDRLLTGRVSQLVSHGRMGLPGSGMGSLGTREWGSPTGGG